MSRDVHNGPTDQHNQARGEPYRGDPAGGDEAAETAEPRKLTLDSWHRAHGGRMVPFAGYEMPVQFEGIMAEHLWTREHAGLFDVSHMGQLTLAGEGAAEALERLVPGDMTGLRPNRVRYSLLLTGDGGIIDDLMVTNAGEYLYLVVNGATKWDDLAHMRSELPDSITINHMEDSALLALQGPEAAAVLAGMIPAVADLAFMEAGAFEWEGHDLWISRSGYTGEDGFEISIPAASAQAFADALVADARVKPIGLGARDSLRLEAGLPLYGHDLDTEITPVMADLGFAIGKRRRSEGGFAGAGRIGAELESGPVQKRIGIEVDGRQPVREGARILDEEGNEVGKVTSGGFSPTLQRPIAMGYVAEHLAEPGTGLKLEQRSKLFEGRVTAMPFVPHRYHRKGAAK